MAKTSARVLSARMKPKRNLIKPFTSGAWSKHANLVVNGDYSATLNVNGTYQLSTIILLVKRNKTYTIACTHNGKLRVRGVQTNAIYIGYDTSQVITFTVGEDTEISVFFGNSTETSGAMTFNNLILIEGSSYDGVFTPYEEVPDLKRPRMKTGKNLFDGTYIDGFITSTDQTLGVDIYDTRTTNWFSVKPNTKYIIGGVGINRNRIQVRSSSNIISYYDTSTVTTPSDAKEMRVYYYTSISGDPPPTNVQIEEGTTATSYEPYTLIPDLKPSARVLNAVR